MHRVLLADDSKPIQRVVELTLDREDLELRIAIDGDDALDLVGAGFAPDVALVDVHMPRMNGFELCRRLKEIDPDLRVLLLVGTFEPFDADEGQSVGAAGHLLKPFSADELGAWVAELLGDAGGGLDTPARDDTVEPVADDRPAESSAAEDVEATAPAPSMLMGSAGAGEQDHVERHGSTDRASEQQGTAELPSQETSAPLAGPSGQRPTRVRLAPEDVDALARKIAEHLADNLFRGNADELFARVASEEVRTRISQLEQELADSDD